MDNAEPDRQEQTVLEFSLKVIEALSVKAKRYNSTSNKKVSVSQLKKVYVKGASNKNDERPAGDWAMARVNMFIRLISSNTFKEVFSKKNKGGTSFSNLEIDVAENWEPSKEDFAQASLDIEEFKLEYNFQDIDELYLNENPTGFSFEV